MKCVICHVLSKLLVCDKPLFFHSSYSPNVPVQYSPYTFSSAPQSVNYLSSNSPSMPRTSSSPSTAALVDSPRTSSGYSTPTGLPGMSEKR